MPKKHQRSMKKQAASRCTASNAAELNPLFDPSSSEYEEYCERRYNEVIKKSFGVNCYMDWFTLQTHGLEMSVKDMLRQEYTSPDGKKTYYYEEWEELLYKVVPIYQELCWEFHSTYILKLNPEGLDDKDFMRFRLGGKAWQMSLLDFTRCLKIYSPKQMREQHFRDYIWSGARVSSAIKEEEEFNPNKVWQEFSSVSSWSPDGVSHLYIHDVYFRLIHLFFTLIITHRTEDTKKVNLYDLWFLEQIRSKTHVNIPYCMAYYLNNMAATGNDPNIPICGGLLVTLIANHLGVTCEGIQVGTLDERRTITCMEYIDAKVIYLGQKNPKKEPPPGNGNTLSEILKSVVKYQNTLKEMMVNLRLQQETLTAHLVKLSQEPIPGFEKLSQEKQKIKSVPAL